MERTLEDLDKLGVIDKDGKENLKTIFEYLNAVGIDSIGRFGSWEYANMDAVVRMVKDYVQGTELPRVSIIILNWNGWQDTIGA